MPISTINNGEGAASVRSKLNAAIGQANKLENIADVEAALAGKADTTALTSGLAAKADITALTAGLATKADTAHTHVIADVTSLQATLDGKATTAALTAGLATKANTAHTHVISDTTGLQTALDGKAASAHTHSIDNVTGLQTAIDAKLDVAVAPELIRDTVGAALVGTGGIVVTPNDGSDTITIDGSGISGGNSTDHSKVYRLEDYGGWGYSGSESSSVFITRTVIRTTKSGNNLRFEVADFSGSFCPDGTFITVTGGSNAGTYWVNGANAANNYIEVVYPAGVEETVGGVTLSFVDQRLILLEEKGVFDVLANGTANPGVPFDNKAAFLAILEDAKNTSTTSAPDVVVEIDTSGKFFPISAGINITGIDRVIIKGSGKYHSGFVLLKNSIDSVDKHWFIIEHNKLENTNTRGPKTLELVVKDITLIATDSETAIYGNGDDIGQGDIFHINQAVGNDGTASDTKYPSITAGVDPKIEFVSAAILNAPRHGLWINGRGAGRIDGCYISRVGFNGIRGVLYDFHIARNIISACGESALYLPQGTNNVHCSEEYYFFNGGNQGGRFRYDTTTSKYQVNTSTTSTPTWTNTTDVAITEALASVYSVANNLQFDGRIEDSASHAFVGETVSNSKIEIQASSLGSMGPSGTPRDNSFYDSIPHIDFDAAVLYTTIVDANTTRVFTSFDVLTNSYTVGDYLLINGGSSANQGSNVLTGTYRIKAVNATSNYVDLESDASFAVASSGTPLSAGVFMRYHNWPMRSGVNIMRIIDNPIEVTNADISMNWVTGRDGNYVNYPLWVGSSNLATLNVYADFKVNIRVGTNKNKGWRMDDAYPLFYGWGAQCFKDYVFINENGNAVCLKNWNVLLDYMPCHVFYARAEKPLFEQLGNKQSRHVIFDSPAPVRWPLTAVAVGTGDVTLSTTGIDSSNAPLVGSAALVVGANAANNGRFMVKSSSTSADTITVINPTGFAQTGLTGLDKYVVTGAQGDYISYPKPIGTETVYELKTILANGNGDKAPIIIKGLTGDFATITLDRDGQKAKTRVDKDGKEQIIACDQFETISGTSYTLLPTDHGKKLKFTSGSTVTVTVNWSALTADFDCVMIQEGAGKIVLSGTQDFGGNERSKGVGAVIGVIKTGPSTGYAVGALEDNV